MQLLSVMRILLTVLVAASVSEALRTRVPPRQLSSSSSQLSLHGHTSFKLRGPTQLNAAAVAPAAIGIGASLARLPFAAHPWYVWTMLSLASTVGIASERTQLGAMLSSPLVTMGVSMLLCNLGLLPSESKVYSMIMKWLVPLSIPLLLLDADLKKCLQDTGTLIKAFMVGSLGTVIGTFVAFWLVPLKFAGGGAPKIAAALCARHIGGAVNFVAVSDILKVQPDLLAASMAADNVVVAAYFAFLFLISAPERNGPVGANDMLPASFSSEALQQEQQAPAPAVAAPAAKCPIPMFSSQGETEGASESQAAAVPVPPPQLQQALLSPREKQAVSLLGVSAAISAAFVICSASMGLSHVAKGRISPMLLSSLMAVAAATIFPRTLSRVSKAGGIVGVLFMQMFFAVTGGQGHIPTVLSYGPSLFLHTLVQIAVHFTFAVGAGKVLRLPFREVVLASNANVGGPTTAAGMASMKRWKTLVLPALLTGIFGYAIATGAGLGVYHVLLKLSPAAAP